MREVKEPLNLVVDLHHVFIDQMKLTTHTRLSTVFDKDCNAKFHLST